VTPRNADASERWDEAVRRFVGMTTEELSDLHIRDLDGDQSSDDFLLLAVDALDQAGIDVQRVRLVSR
jgi:hypothetical protein